MVIELLENWSTPVNRILLDYFSHYDVVAAVIADDDDDYDDDDDRSHRLSLLYAICLNSIRCTARVSS